MVIIVPRLLGVNCDRHPLFWAWPVVSCPSIWVSMLCTLGLALPAPFCCKGGRYPRELSGGRRTTLGVPSVNNGGLPPECPGLRVATLHQDHPTPFFHKGYPTNIFAGKDGYLVDSASSHMLVSKIKPCMSKYKQLYCETANGSLNQLSFI